MIVSPTKIPLLMPEQQGITDTNSSSGKADFGSYLAKAVNDLNQSQVAADNISDKFLAGQVDNLHEVTIAMEKAKLTMQLAVQVRTKMVEAYQEISRMQI